MPVIIDIPKRLAIEFISDFLICVKHKFIVFI